MADILVELSKNPQASKLIKTLGLPIPMPTPLRRAKAARTAQPLSGKGIVVCFAPGSPVTRDLAQALVEAGATVSAAGEAPEALSEVSEAFGRPLGDFPYREPGKEKIDGIIFDGTCIDCPDGLGAVYEFFHPIVRNLSRCGRIVVLSRPSEDQKEPAAAAAQAALEGFVRSLSKEIGKKGSTATLLRIKEGSAGRIAGPLRFLLSPRSTYVTGQPLTVTNRAKVRPVGHWSSPLEGKVALVTGAARGIGRATAKVLAAEGATVYCLDRPQEQSALSKLARDLGGFPLGVDISTPEAPDAICEALADGVDIVVHNAGITRDKTLARMKEQWWSQTVDINLGAVERITRQLLQTKTLRTGGRIICLSSVSGIAGNMGQTNYSASKAGVMGLVRAYSTSVGRRGITINAIAPGFIETRMTAAMPIAIREVARRMNSLGQAGDPRDVAEAIAFMASPSSQGITGQVLRVCGGALIGA
jgi:3-oxoacyl-[acyl-carrier protein] reductase